MYQTTSANICKSCCEGEYVEQNLRGKKRPYREKKQVEIQVDIKLPVCQNCGNIKLDKKGRQKLDRALEQAYEQERKQRQTKIIEKLEALDIPQAKVERILGLSRGYLSKVKRQKRVIKTSLLKQLEAMAARPCAAFYSLANSSREAQEIFEELLGGEEPQEWEQKQQDFVSVPSQHRRVPLEKIGEFGSIDVDEIRLEDERWGVISGENEGGQDALFTRGQHSA